MTVNNQISFFLKKLDSTYDDDSTDRWHHVRTITILIGLATTLFLKNYVGEPLQCWPPAQWNDGWEAFAEAYCFVENTYFVPMNQSNLPAHHKREDQEMIYYQWVPFILLLMGLLFYVPRAIWKIFSFYTGLTLPEMMKSARETGKKGNEGKGGQFAKALYREHTAVEISNSIRYGSYLSNLYLLCKTLMLVNVLFQLIFINHWLGTSYTFWGFGIFWDMIHGRHWQESGHFPRVTYCDVTVRELGNVNNWTLQCVLMVNMFNEKIFIFLWFYFAFLLVITFFNWLIWIYRRFSSSGTIDFIKELVAQKHSLPSSANVGKFKDRILKNDGLLLIRMIDENSGRLFASEVTRELWSLWEGESRERSSSGWIYPSNQSDHSETTPPSSQPVASSTPFKPYNPILIEGKSGKKLAHLEDELSPDSEWEDDDTGPIGLHDSHFSEPDPPLADENH